MTYWLHLDTLGVGSQGYGEPTKKKAQQAVVVEEDEDQVNFEDTARDTDSSSSDSQEAKIFLSHL